MFKRIAKRLVALTPYRIVSSAPNRFEELAHVLRHLRKLHYEPKLIIDGGAHVGSFSRLAHEVFPGASIHMVEPQPACHAGLKALGTAYGFRLHKVALEEKSGTAELVFNLAVDSGAHVGGPLQPGDRTVTITTATLDELFASTILAADRTLLKLDLQGHELRALAGATSVLPLVEMVITEVSFFQQFDEPRIPELVGFFDQRGFDLFDVASLSGRTRDGRLRQGDFLFVNRHSPLCMDKQWN